MIAGGLRGGRGFSGVLFAHDLSGKPVPTFPDHALAAARAARDSGSHFGDQQGVVEWVDNAGQCRPAFLAGEGVTLETAGIDDVIFAAAKREVGAAARTPDRLSAVRFAGLGPAGDDGVAHRGIANCFEFPGREF